MTLDELKKLAEAATPSPWEVYGPHIFKSGDESANVASVADPWKRQIVGYTELDLMRRDACLKAWSNRDYIVAACNALPKLLEMIEVLRQACSGRSQPQAFFCQRAIERVDEIERSL